MDGDVSTSQVAAAVKHELHESEERESHTSPQQKGRPRKSRKDDGGDSNKKRRCISSACVPCRKRKSKCDGTTPACSACAAVYNTECIYDPNSDHRRKGVYKKDIDNLKTRNSTLQTLIQAILNYPEDEVLTLVRQIRECESLDSVAEDIMRKENGLEEEDEDDLALFGTSVQAPSQPSFESHLSGKMGELRLEDGSTRYFGGTSVLLNLGDGGFENDPVAALAGQDQFPQASENPISSWTNVTKDPEIILHLLNMYFTWHYTFFTTLSKGLFYRDFARGNPGPHAARQPEYCSPLLVNAMLALGCHFTSLPSARENRDDSSTAGDHFFKEAKRLILEGDLHEQPRLTTVQALALMSVREAGCGREAKGWVYSGMSFRMACDLGLNLNSGGMYSRKDTAPDDSAEDARRVTFWGCFLFDKCWSNYLGRLPQLPKGIITVPKFEVFPNEESEIWSAYTDSGFSQAHAQPSRTRTVARQISALCEISSDLMSFFYNPIDMDKAKGKHTELKKLSDIHQRLEAWRRELPKELEPREGGLPSMLMMHMFFQLLYIHLFRPFLKYNQHNTPLPAHVSPRKICTQAAAMISKLLRLYKRSHGLRQICNIAVYIAHSACTIHLLNLPDKIARRDIVHGVRHLEEIAEGWICARRALGILSVLAKKWNVELPEEAATVLERSEKKFGPFRDVATPKAGTAVIAQLQQQMVSTESPPPAVYSVSVPASSPNFLSSVNTLPTTTTNPNAPFFTTASATEARRSMSDNRSMPAFSVADYALPGDQRQASSVPVGSTPPVTTPGGPSRLSVDGGGGPSKGSPSELWNGVEQLVKEGQDWWLRDQAQLANNWNSGFDNWNLSSTDMSWLNGNGAAMSTTGGAVGPIPAMNTIGNDGNNTSVSTTATGSPISFQSPGASLGSLNGGVGGLSTYNEEEWYQ